MPLFSQRKGINPLQKNLQKDNLDQETRNGLWSIIQIGVFDNWNYKSLYGDLDYVKSSKQVEALYRNIWFSFFKKPIDTVPSANPEDKPNAYNIVRSVILEGRWHDALDMIEFIVRNSPEEWQAKTIEYCNHILTRENSAYRFIGTEITEITDEIEIESIASALASPKETVNQHFSNALSLLSDRKSPDYRNSIKESISAVESLCKIISRKQNGTLSECLKIIQNSHPMHKAFQTALSNLYGYTSDEGGIRHALTEDSSLPTYADAKFMLVSCTAFVNYLLTIAAEKNIPLGK